MELLCGLELSEGMPIAITMAHQDTSADHEMHLERRTVPREVRSDCWPDCCPSEEDAESLEAAARLNTPSIVLGDIGKVLGVVVVAIFLIDLGLYALHIH